MWRCRLYGHDYRFSPAGSTMVWSCTRGCGARGSKEYRSASDATRFANAFNKRDTDDLGRRAPLLGMFPLRLWRRLRSPQSAPKE